MATHGLDSGNRSPNGDWAMGDKANRSMFTWIDFDINLVPQCMQDLGVDNYCLDHELSETVVQTYTSTSECPEGGVSL